MDIQSAIKTSVRKIIAHDQFMQMTTEKKVEVGDLIAINNSFLYRDLITTKSNSYLVLKRGKAETSYSVFITKGLNMNKNFNLYSSKMPNESLPNLEPLSAIVESEIENIGHIVFALIGYIQEGVVLSEKFQHANITEIVWDSARNDLFFIDGSTLCINDANNEDSLWRSLTNYCDQSGIEYNEDKLKQEFGSVLLKL